jgi:MoaA/NifB/PqqE/SkfB family radical SAM enzyme
MLQLSHTPRRARRRMLPTAYDLAKIGFFLFGLPKNAFGSIDVSKECNLRCKHCYFFEQDYASELTVDQWIGKLEDLRRITSRREFPFFQCTWVGGEPLIRKDLIERGRKYFRHNTVVTNGTIPLPDWPDVHFYISIDGDEATHESIRKKKGIYKRAMRNVGEHPELEVTIAYCITAENKHCIEQAVIDWARAGASRMTFDFYTPIETIVETASEPLFVPLDERDRILDDLLDLKRIYGDFFVLPERVFRLMKSDVCKQVTDNCLFSEKSFAFGPSGEPKEKCMMGPKADCDRCGCVVPFYLASLVDRKLIVEDLAGEWRSAAQRAARGVTTALFA